MDKELLWNIKNVEKIKDCRIFQLEKTLALGPNEEEKNFFRINSPDWVTIIPVLKDSPTKDFQSAELLLVRQFRHGSSSISLEFPAGMVDPNELPEEAAKRELLEETGYTADKWTLIASVNPNPAFMTNTTHTYLAEGLQYKSKQNTDPDEFIKISHKTIQEVSNIIGKPPFESAIMVQAYFFFLKAYSSTEKPEDIKPEGLLT